MDVVVHKVAGTPVQDIQLSGLLCQTRSNIIPLHVERWEVHRQFPTALL